MFTDYLPHPGYCFSGSDLIDTNTAYQYSYFNSILLLILRSFNAKKLQNYMTCKDVKGFISFNWSNW